METRQAILEAVKEYDRLGQEAFLEKYGFGHARQFFLELHGQLYDSKAIWGVAHRYEFPQEGPLHRRKFSGGAPIKRKLEKLGFTVHVLPE